MAADLGKRLLAEVEEVGLDEILNTLRLQHNPEPAYFGLPRLDNIVNAAISTRPDPTNPIIELISQAPGSGTTQLLYLLTATAILPAAHNGKNSCVAILDADNTFSTKRLVQQLNLHLPPNEPASTLTTALTHVHIFRPQSLPSLLETLASLPTYLLHTTHPSLSRPLAFIALDSTTAFHWQSKAAEENLAFASQHASTNTTHQPSPPNPPQSQSTLPFTLKTLTKSLPTPLLLTSHSHAPPLPPSLPTVRLKVHRRLVRAFPPTLSVSEALREASDRQRAVEGAGWEARVMELGAEQRGLRGFGFGFGIEGEGVVLEGDGR